MSFSAKVKEELSSQHGTARHCQIAELAAILEFCGKIYRDRHGMLLFRIQTENTVVARKSFTLLRKAFNIYSGITIRSTPGKKNTHVYFLHPGNIQECTKILQAVRIAGDHGEDCRGEALVSSMLIAGSCCKRSFIRGAFLAAGSISDPLKFYHLEIVCSARKKAEQLRDIMNYFEVDAKVVERKKYFVVYIKEGTKIVDMLNIMEAHVSLMELENMRIVKEMRNTVNRRVNCETANINKTVSASVKQLEDIRLIEQTAGLGRLSDHLREMAELRLENPDAALKELGEMLVPPVGKSGVNHRLRKISEYAEMLREQRRRTK